MTNYRIYEDFDGVKEEVITKEEEIEEFMNLPYDEQLRVYFQKGSRPMKRIVRYENSEKYLSLESVVGEGMTEICYYATLYCSLDLTG